MSAGADWTGSAGYFTATPGTVDQLPSGGDSAAGSDATASADGTSEWDAFWGALGPGLPGDPNLTALGPATASVLGPTATQAAGAAIADAAASIDSTASSIGSSITSGLSSVWSWLQGFGIWAIVILALFLLIVIFEKV